MEDAIPLDLVRELQSHRRIRHISVHHSFIEKHQPVPFQYLISLPKLTRLSLLIADAGWLPATLNQDLQRSFTSLLSSSLRHHLKHLGVKLQLGGASGELIGERDFYPAFFVPDLPVLEELELHEFGKREWYRMPKVFRPCDPWNFHAGKYPALRSLKLHKYAYSYELMRSVRARNLREFVFEDPTEPHATWKQDCPGDIQTLQDFLEEVDYLEELELDSMTVKTWITVYPEDSNTGKKFPFTPLFERHGGSLKSLRWPELFNWICGFGRTPGVAEKYWAVIRTCCPFLRDLWVEHRYNEVADRILWTSLVEQRMWNLTYIHPCPRSRAET
jgi:hypothetical protein